MTVHARSAVVEQDRAGRPGADGAVDSPPDRRRQRDQDHLAAFAADAQHPVAVLFAEITDICAGGLEDPQGPGGPAWPPGRSRCGWRIRGRL